MPLKSVAQEKYLWAKHPDIAQKFENETPKSAKKHLPYHVSGRKKALQKRLAK
jgi:hypothetical protein